MNILFILPQIPYPPHSGGRIVTWNTVKRFARACKVSVVCLYHHPDELKDLHKVEEICEEVKAFPAWGKWSPLPMLKSLVSTSPYKAHRFYNAEMDRYIRELLQRKRFDVIHVQNFYPTTCVRGDEDCLKVHYKENVEGNILLRYSQRSRNPFIKAAAYIEGLRTRRFELNACRKFDQILTISPIDRDTLLALDPALSIMHQRPGVDLNEYPLLDEPQGTPSVVFTGTMSYYPNSNGVYEFLRNVWQRVRAHVPEMECYIVGASPPDSIRQFDGRDGVHITGRVPSVGEYLQNGLIYIVPLLIGGGIRLKILEAMASGRTIVSTPVGCEGLEGKHNEHLLIADMPDAFADAIVELVRNPEKRQRLRSNARTLAEEFYDWDTVIYQQVEYYRSRLSAAVERGLHSL
ncbi:MAG: glycosyltransferase [bacterium]